MTTAVRFFRSTDSGASSLSKTAGTLLNVLNACLITGYGTVTLTSLTVSGGVATAQVDAGHNFTMLGAPGNPQIGPIIRIQGATGAGASLINTDHRIAVVSANQFTFPLSGFSGTATGTITAKLAPLDWSKPFSTGNKAVYRPAAGLQHYLRIDDDGSTLAVGATGVAPLRAYESMSGIDTGSMPYPDLAIASYHHKCPNADGNFPWLLIGDDRTYYLFAQHSISGGLTDYYSLSGFGDIIPLAAGDGFYSAVFPIWASGGTVRNLYQGTSHDVSSGYFLARDPGGLNPGIAAGTKSLGFSGAGVFPSVYGATAILGDILCIHNTNRDVRGRLRGLWSSGAHNPGSIANTTILYIDGRIFIYQRMFSSAGLFIELSDWPS